MAAIVGKQVKVAQSQVGSGAIPSTVKARPPFVFTCSQRSWGYDEEAGEWLPVLSRMLLDPGMNGVAGDGNPATAITEHEQRGRTVIRSEDPRLVDGLYRFYLREFPRQGPGPFWLSQFESVEIMPGGHVFVERNEVAYREFRRFLVTSGLVPALDPRWKRVILSEMRSTLQRKRGRADKTTEGSYLRRRADEYESYFAAAEKAGTPLDSKPEPKKRTPRKKATPKPEATP